MKSDHVEIITHWLRQDMLLYEQALRQYEEQMRGIQIKISKNATKRGKMSTKRVWWPVIRWQLPLAAGRRHLNSLSACSVSADEGSEYHGWFAATQLLFSNSLRFPRYPFDDRNVRSFETIFGKCNVRRNGRRIRPMYHLVERIWCGFDAFYHSNIELSLQYFDEAMSMIALRSPLSVCLDHSPWPFTRHQILVNMFMYHKIAYSPFLDTSSFAASSFGWLSHTRIANNRLETDPRDMSPYQFYSRFDQKQWELNQQHYDS